MNSKFNTLSFNPRAESYLSVTSKGVSFFANRFFTRGEILGTFVGEEVTEDTRDWREPYMLQVAPKKYLVPYEDITKYMANYLVSTLAAPILAHLGRAGDDSESTYVWFTNHSCDPNARVSIGDKIQLIATKDILPKEEITFDYSTTQIEPWSMICKCDAKSCRDVIGPSNTLSKLHLAKYCLTRSIPKYALKHAIWP